MLYHQEGCPDAKEITIRRLNTQLYFEEVLWFGLVWSAWFRSFVELTLESKSDSIKEALKERLVGKNVLRILWPWIIPIKFALIKLGIFIFSSAFRACFLTSWSPRDQSMRDQAVSSYKAKKMKKAWNLRMGVPLVFYSLGLDIMGAYLFVIEFQEEWKFWGWGRYRQ